MASKETKPERRTAGTEPLLVEQYRAIGPAAVLAALVCKRDTPKTQAAPGKAA